MDQFAGNMAALLNAEPGPVNGASPSPAAQRQVARDVPGGPGHGLRAGAARRDAAGPEGVRLVNGFSPGDAVAKYELVRKIGQGGLGEVWEATDRVLDRPVAVKFILGAGGMDPAERARLLKEARAAARVAHPHIVVVHAVDVASDPPLLEMELLAGPSLAQRLQAGPLDAQEAVALALQVAGALAAAHRQGVVHRDVKPANLVFDAYGSLKVCDFGIARLREAATLAHVTSHGFGSPEYAAPEQWGDEPVDGRADLYALGCVLFAMLTGQPPFPFTGNIGSVIARHAAAPPPPPSSLRPGLPRAMDQLVAMLLAKRPGDRPTSAAEVIASLESIQPSLS
jgi:eukaryotic-like serine/threonine-protein kinase